LGVLDLFPLFSWIFLKGKCRYCGEKISVQYPIVEFLNMALWVFLFSQLGFTPAFFIAALIFSLLLALTVIDIFHMLLPDVLVICVLVLSLIYTVLVRKMYLDSLFGILVGGGFFLLIVLLSKGRAMGMGDVKLTAVIGLLLGFKATVLTCGIAFVIGAIVSLVLVARKKAEAKTAVPFGPFICVGALISFLYADALINIYLALCVFGA
jgi:leader peptidase (prepilin peptidase)/N-methyltransferase